MSVIKGPAHVFGDDIDTDRIIPGKYTKTLDAGQLAAHVLEDLDPGFSDHVRHGDILVAGRNFGCGSSREQAALALKAAGIAAIVGEYFARIFYRNAINIGLPVVEIGPHAIEEGHEISVDLAQGTVYNHTDGATYEATRMPSVMRDILAAGGLVEYLKYHGGYSHVD